uniref:Caveolae associated protein 2 n=1 Tax=Propithecus coquereli TaxID=379532 RepID=A0A2K6FK09_PROCO
QTSGLRSVHHRPSRQSKHVPTCLAMGEDAVQAEKFQHLGSDVRQEKPTSPSLMPCSMPSPSLNLGSTEVIRDNSKVNVVTVLALLDKLVNMLDAVQENQNKMEQRQISLEGSVKGIQNDLTKLSKYQAFTSNTVSKLLEKSRKERMDRQCTQVKRLENNHAQLLRRNHFKVLIFQEENEIPASVFVKDPVPSAAEGKEELADEDALEDSAEEKREESRVEKIKGSSLRKVDSLKEAFSRQNIEKKMNKLGTKIVSVERRGKIKESLTSNHQKTSSGKSSPFKVAPLTFGRKKVQEGESPAENETRLEDMPSSEQMPSQEEASFAEGLSEASLASALLEGDNAEGAAKKAACRGSNSGLDSNVDLTIMEDEEGESVALQQAQKVRYEGGYELTSEEAERSDEEQVGPAVLQVDQSA